MVKDNKDEETIKKSECYDETTKWVLFFLGMALAAIIVSAVLEGDGASVSKPTLDKVCQELYDNPDVVFVDTYIMQKQFLCTDPTVGNDNIYGPEIECDNCDVLSKVSPSIPKEVLGRLK